MKKKYKSNATNAMIRKRNESDDQIRLIEGTLKEYNLTNIRLVSHGV